MMTSLLGRGSHNTVIFPTNHIDDKEMHSVNTLCTVVSDSEINNKQSSIVILESTGKMGSAKKDRGFCTGPKMAEIV